MRQINDLGDLFGQVSTMISDRVYTGSRLADKDNTLPDNSQIFVCGKHRLFSIQTRDVYRDDHNPHPSPSWWGDHQTFMKNSLTNVTMITKPRYIINISDVATKVELWCLVLQCHIKLAWFYFSSIDLIKSAYLCMPFILIWPELYMGSGSDTMLESFAIVELVLAI